VKTRHHKVQITADTKYQSLIANVYGRQHRRRTSHWPGLMME